MVRLDMCSQELGMTAWMGKWRVGRRKGEGL